MRPSGAYYVLGGSGVLWCAAALASGAWLEAVFCGAIGAGFLGAALAMGGRLPRGAFRFGLFAAMAGTVAPFVAYGFGGLDLGTSAVLVTAVGIGVLAVARTNALLVGAAIAGALGSLVMVLLVDLRGLSVWTAGNVGMLLGFGLLAWTLAAPARAPGPRKAAA